MKDIFSPVKAVKPKCEIKKLNKDIEFLNNEGKTVMSCTNKDAPEIMLLN